MLTTLLKQLVNSVAIVFRTFKAFFTRQIISIGARAKRITSISRQAAKLAPKALQSVALAGKKPTKREDYLETKRLFISKSFIVVAILAVVALALLIYFVAAPWLISKFGTARLFVESSRVEEYDGKVKLYYDKGRDQLMFHGAMEEGVITGYGEAYDEDGALVYAGGYQDGVYSGEGQLYNDGVLLYEGDFLGGIYDGEGTLYSPDGGKLYEGGFAEGAYSGAGTLYDENGSEKYAGQFADGLYEGQGRLYEDGSLVYEGGFAANVPSGEGSFWSDGVKRYKGHVEEGVRSGEGSEFNEAGQLIYRGEFADDRRSGTGIEYFDGETVRYKGEFLDDSYEGEGELHSGDGSLLYTGGFRGGLYDGAGTLYPAADESIEAEFTAGFAQGQIIWTKQGALYYEGAAKDTVPNGFGSLYTKKGACVYQGEMLNGSVDAASLIGISAEELREIFADAATVETAGSNGFTIENTQLGLTAFLSYKQGESEPQVYYAYLYNHAQVDDRFDLLPWDSNEAYELWAQESGLGGYKKVQLQLEPDFAGELPFASGVYHRTMYIYDEYIFSMWSRREGGEIFMVEWHMPGVLSEGEAIAEGDEASSGRLMLLLERLGLSEGEDAEVTLSANELKNEFYGVQPSKPLLMAAADAGADAEDAPEDEELRRGRLESVVTAALAYYKAAEDSAAYTEQLELKNELLLEETALIRTGRGDEDAAAELSDQISAIELEINRCKAEMEKQTLTVKSVTGLELSGFDLQEIIFYADVMDMDAEAVLSAAIDYAQAQADKAAAEDEAAAKAAAEAEEKARAESEAAQAEAIEQAIAQMLEQDKTAEQQQSGEASPPEKVAEVSPQPAADTADTNAPADGESATLENPLEAEVAAELAAPAADAPEQGSGESADKPEIDREAIEADVKLRLVELEIAGQTAIRARDSYFACQKDLEKLETAYQTGGAARSEVYDAMCMRSQLRIELYDALCACTEQMYQLNDISGGFLAREYDWYPEIFTKEE